MSSTTMQSEQCARLLARGLPADAELVISAMEAGASPEQAERRGPSRWRFHCRAHLFLFSDKPAADPWTLYVRDIATRSLGFVAPDALPLGHGGWVELLDPSGQRRSIQCTLSRCREAVRGWFEGALHFNREQHWFEPTTSDAAPEPEQHYMRLHPADPIPPAMRGRLTKSHSAGRPMMRLVPAD